MDIIKAEFDHLEEIVNLNLLKRIDPRAIDDIEISEYLKYRPYYQTKVYKKFKGKHAHPVDFYIAHENKPVGFVELAFMELKYLKDDVVHSIPASHFITKSFIKKPYDKTSIFEKIVDLIETELKEKGIDRIYTRTRLESWNELFSKRGYVSLGTCCSCFRFSKEYCKNVELLELYPI